RPLSHATDRDERDRRIAQLADIFVNHLVVRFDESQERPRFEYEPASRLDDLAKTASVARLTGRVPAGTHSVALGYALATGSYAVSVHIADSPVQTSGWRGLFRANRSRSLPLAGLSPGRKW